MYYCIYRRAVPVGRSDDFYIADIFRVYYTILYTYSFLSIRLKNFFMQGEIDLIQGTYEKITFDQICGIVQNELIRTGYASRNI